MFLCAISGEAPQEPVVSKSGKVYEKRLILKYILDNGTDPTTGEKLEESDLIPIQATPDTAAPRPPSHTSIPALLRTLQNEWDALVLETFARQQQYNQTRQELSYALYSQDAATRVVARLIRERDAAREALSNVQASMGIEPTAPGADDVEMDDAAPALPKEVSAKIEELQATLSATRKKRKPSPGYATAADVKSFTPKHAIPSLHAASPAGITALAVSKKNPSQFLTGGNDKMVQLYDKDTDKVLFSNKGHTKKINYVAFRENDNDPTLLVSAGADKIAKIWSLDGASGEYIPKSTIRTHKGEITGLAVHPTSTYLTLASTDKTYSVHDLNTFTELFRSAPSDDAFASLSIHPDGQLLAFGTPSSAIHIYDIRSGAIAASLTPSDTTPFTVHSLSFSENGYHLMAPLASSTVAVWDLRKQLTATTIPLGDDFKINKLVYDTSAQFLGVTGSGGGRVFAHKSWEELIRLEEGGEMTELVFGGMGKEIWGSTGREVRIWGSA